jgi:hypothetical protein
MRILQSLVVAALIVCSLTAQTFPAPGPDVVVGTLTDFGNYGTNGSGIYAYSIGTDACNYGDTPIPWSTANNNHPVIAQQIYRLKGVAGQPYSRFEQLGMSWLKHGFAAVNGSTCHSCQGGGPGLGVGCSDPYSSGLNGSQGNGPRSDVNPTTGVFPYPSTSYPAATPTIGRRIQIPGADVDPVQNPGALYWGEAHYVTPVDAAAGNGLNNASYRSLSFAAVSYNGTFSGSTTRFKPAIYAWQVADPAVQITTVDFPNDGRFDVAKRVTSLGGGNYHYEFCVHNHNSDRAAGGFTVNLPGGTVITGAGFRSVPYHSGEIWDGSTPWTATINGGSINWATPQTYQQNPNANALRWGTSYNFWFNATASAEIDTVIDLFKPEPCPADPVVTPPGNYVLNTAAAFDNPTLTAPLAGPSGDDATQPVPIGFTFLFFGTNYTTLNICTNGFLQFNGSNNTYQNTCIPSTGVPNNIIAGYWDDLWSSAGQITYQTIGSAPNRRFVASWNVVHYPSGSGIPANFKIILDEGTNKITSTIITSGNGGSSATRGVENSAGNGGTQASCSQANSAVANTSQTYTWNTTIIPSAVLTVTGNTGPGGVLTWAVNSNAPSAPVVIVASLDPGPLDLGPTVGILNVGLTPGLYAVIADGAGALGAANGAHATDWHCGDFQTSLPMGGGLPPGLTIYNQGVVIGPGSNPPPPNTQFHITTPVTITT